MTVFFNNPTDKSNCRQFQCRIQDRIFTLKISGFALISHPERSPPSKHVPSSRKSFHCAQRVGLFPGMKILIPELPVFIPITFFRHLLHHQHERLAMLSSRPAEHDHFARNPGPAGLHYHLRLGKFSSLRITWRHDRRLPENSRRSSRGISSPPPLGRRSMINGFSPAASPITLQIASRYASLAGSEVTDTHAVGIDSAVQNHAASSTAERFSAATEIHRGKHRGCACKSAVPGAWRDEYPCRPTFEVISKFS
jgi:hypothetical protein